MYFPADVSLRVTGDRAAAQRLFPAAKQLLFRALRMQETGGNVPVRLFQPGTDGSLIWVWLHQGLKLLYVQAGPTSINVPPHAIEEEEFEVPIACPDLLSGVVSPGEAVVGSTGVGYAAHEFHPTQTSTNVYGVSYAWQDVDRLGVATDPQISPTVLQVRWPKPSMYSGAMTRVVQAIYGIGQTSAGPIAQNHYDYRWGRTDGLVKVDKSFWLVRVSRDEGVLAMSLPLFDCTTANQFKQALQDVGDIDTFAIVDEFGGLPSGDTFPAQGDPRNAAIEAGTVLQLLSSVDVAAFYQNGAIDKFPLFAGCGWAFSTSGMVQEAHNTTFWYSNRAAATAEFSTWATDGFNSLPLEDRMLRAEHWKLTFGIVNATADLPASGAAVLSLVEASLMIGEPKITDPFRFGLPFIKVPGAAEVSENIYTFEYWGRISGDESTFSPPLADISCPVSVFYISDVLEVVRHQPPKGYVNGIIRGAWVEGAPSAGGAIPHFSEYGFSYVTKDATHCDTQRYDVGADGMGYFDAFLLDVGEYWATDGIGNCVHTENVINSIVQARHHPPANQSPLTLNGVPISIYDYYEPAGPVITTQTIEVGFTGHPLSAEWVLSSAYVVNYRVPFLRAGRFYSTAVDLRSDKRHGTARSHEPVPVALDYADLWQEEVGFVVLPGCREGGLFVRYFGGYTDPPSGVGIPLPAGVQQRGLFFNALIDLVTLPESEVNFEGTAGSRWNSIWTSVLNYQFKGGACVNAGPTICRVVSNGVYRAHYDHDAALETITGRTISVPELPASYLGSAGGIDVSQRAAVDITYVGAV
jgi:hypothetical protein